MVKKGGVKTLEEHKKRMEWVLSGQTDKKNGLPCNPPKSKLYARAYRAGYATYERYASTFKNAGLPDQSRVRGKP